MLERKAADTQTLWWDFRTQLGVVLPPPLNKQHNKKFKKVKKLEKFIHLTCSKKIRRQDWPSKQFGDPLPCKLCFYKW